MKQSKLKIGALIAVVMITVGLLMPVESFCQGGRTDNFFSSGSGDYSNRDEGDAEVSGGITNDNFGAPLGSGLLIMTAAGAGYVLRKKRKRMLLMLAALVLVLGTTQCKKRQEVVKYDDNRVNITLDVCRDTKIDVNTVTGAVSFADGDEIIVASGGKYVGRLTYDEGVFSGSISIPEEDDYLHFYNLGNVEITNLEEGVSSGCSVNISDQINSLPVISYGHSSEKFDAGRTSYEALLHNKCALVKFNVATLSDFAATCITGMNNKVTVDFSNASFTYDMENDGKIALASGSGERWAILLPQNEMAAGSEGSAFSGRYIGNRGMVPEIHADDYLNEGIAVIMNTLHNPAGALNGEFTVNSDGKKVVFAKSNLAYIRATHGWMFRNDQYTRVEEEMDNISSNYGNKELCTLFEWGQTGYNHGAETYIPDEINTNQSACYVYGDPNANLYDQTGKADWGYVSIENGGKIYKQWRTLTIDEWDYIFNGRSGAEQKFGRAIIDNNYKGVILLPDEWSAPEGINFISGTAAACTDNSYSLSEWQDMENAGAVFLTYSGYRFNIGVQGTNKYVFLWSSTTKDNWNAYMVKVTDKLYAFRQRYSKISGLPVRLVCE